MKDRVRHCSAFEKALRALLGVAVIIGCGSSIASAYPAGTKIITTTMYGSEAVGPLNGNLVIVTCKNNVLYANGVASKYTGIVVTDIPFTETNNLLSEHVTAFADGNQVKIILQEIILPANTGPAPVSIDLSGLNVQVTYFTGDLPFPPE
jgi:hypothetical protein